MAKANQAYHKRDLYSDAAQVMTLARYYAKQAVKAQWQGQGHPELIAFATERYRSFVESGLLKPPRTRRKPTP